MDGAWVGTWRPHRPCGLISAQFPSPGPQYSIPGTTGYVGHSPTKAHAPAYSFIGFKLPAVDSCGPGPCYFVEPAISRKGKQEAGRAPGTHLQGRPRTKTAITPRPSDYCIEAASRHVFKCPPVPSVASRREPIQTDRIPGPDTYMLLSTVYGQLPRLIGPNTAYTSASPCNSLTGRSQRGRFDEDLAKTLDPTSFPRVAVDACRTRAPVYTMGARPKPGAANAAKPGPADYSVGRGGKVMLIKPQAPACTFGIQHSIYTTPLIAE
ncbi:LOW QUALITY PROTEIN: ciliary microtubule associated protein 1A-like [Cyrtonyx montezumae]|uniref:LOW QUALITY PROTEIN: ciliary microtubule associated protein 1A-like n=1 Tax=Cyrtonyx montezumae TaxID=9017 RepID=UPI0032DBE6BC